MLLQWLVVLPHTLVHVYVTLGCEGQLWSTSLSCYVHLHEDVEMDKKGNNRSGVRS